MSSPEVAAMKVALAAACMARGLVATQAQEVWEALAGLQTPETVEDAYRQIEDAISLVRNKRLGLT